MGVKYGGVARSRMNVVEIIRHESITATSTSLRPHKSRTENSTEANAGVEAISFAPKVRPLTSSGVDYRATVMGCGEGSPKKAGDRGEGEGKIR